ncbi:MAG TPA: sigma-70 family RNA polymerase sigma factor [Kofleriaceae bacterium]|nr:sigma-70 family RNA polymerase sigma factor [Kofleriaceae bacterium]
MTSATPATVDPRDAELRELIVRGEHERATEEALRSYGPELVGWLCSILPTNADAHDAFSRMSEELWKSLRRFDGRCSVRTWCYMLARHAAARIRGRSGKRREVLVSQIPSLQQAVTRIWTTSSQDAKRTRDVYAEIRTELDEEDQTLLVLRVDRNLAWRDIAQVLLGEDARPGALTRKATALRKQFERVKDRLRSLAARRLD